LLIQHQKLVVSERIGRRTLAGHRRGDNRGEDGTTRP
jgi:hypothetical protein